MNIAVQKLQWDVNCAVGYIGFTVRKNDAIAAGIRWFEREWDKCLAGPVPSHTFVITGPDSTIEAFGNGVHEGTLSSYLHDQDVALLVRRPFQWSAEMGAEIVAEAKKHIGHKYGYWLIAGMAIKGTFLGMALDKVTGGWFGRKVTSWTDGKEQDICSELVALAMKSQSALDRLGVLVRPSNMIDPLDLFSDSHIFTPPDYAVELVD